MQEVVPIDSCWLTLAVTGEAICGSQCHRRVARPTHSQYASGDSLDRELMTIATCNPVILHISRFGGTQFLLAVISLLISFCRCHFAYEQPILVKIRRLAQSSYVQDPDTFDSATDAMIMVGESA